jgi:hypothetical protein
LEIGDVPGDEEEDNVPLASSRKKKPLIKISLTDGDEPGKRRREKSGQESVVVPVRTEKGRKMNLTMMLMPAASNGCCSSRAIGRSIFEIYVAIYVCFSTIARREPASSYVVETTFHISGPEFWQMTRCFPTIRS